MPICIDCIIWKLFHLLFFLFFFFIYFFFYPQYEKKGNSQNMNCIAHLLCLKNLWVSECLSSFVRNLYDTCIIFDKAVEDCVSLLKNILNMKELEGNAFFPHTVQDCGHITVWGSYCQTSHLLLSCNSWLIGTLDLNVLLCCSCYWVLQKSSTRVDGIICCHFYYFFYYHYYVYCKHVVIHRYLKYSSQVQVTHYWIWAIVNDYIPSLMFVQK